MSKTKPKREIKRRKAGVPVYVSETTASEVTTLERPSKVLFDKFKRAEERITRIVITKTTLGKVFPSPPDRETQPFVHPMDEMLDPLSLVNVFSKLRGNTQNLSIELTGEPLNREEMPQLLELFELLAEEVRQAATKETAPIENLPAFALEYFKWKLQADYEKENSKS